MVFVELPFPFGGFVARKDSYCFRKAKVRSEKKKSSYPFDSANGFSLLKKMELKCFTKE